MTAEEHNKTLGTLYFVYSGIHGLPLIGLALLVLVVKLATPASELMSSFWLFVGVAVFVILFLVVGLLPLIVGYGFRRRASWLKPVAFVTAVLSFVNIPIGTALGIYTIKFFQSGAGVKLYGGQAASTESELKNAMQEAQPLMNWAERLKRGEQ
jgi:phosphoglycerol transferase MdoB-like AlkP superfamily enzyme